YSPAGGTVLPAGARSLSAAFTPTDTTDYTTANASVPITIVKATPSIVWPPPASIVYGTALGTAQLNATSSVPGSFVYSPPPGTVLPVGAAQSLSAAFTPADSANYTNAAGSAASTVVGITPTITWTAPAPDSGGRRPSRRPTQQTTRQRQPPSRSPSRRQRRRSSGSRPQAWCMARRSAPRS